MYCLSVYGGLDLHLLNQIQILQNRAARIVCHAPPRSCREEMFQKLDWLTVKQLISYHDLLNIFKIKTRCQPEYLADIFNRVNRFNNIIIPCTKLELARKSFCFRSASMWNRLPESIRNSTTVSEFKRKAKLWIQ